MPGGQHVYLALGSRLLDYPNGQSYVRYIGFTEDPNRRFKTDNHHVVRPTDGVMLLRYSDAMRAVKHRSAADWRRYSSKERQNIGKVIEAVYLTAFADVMGSLPKENDRREHLKAREQLMYEVFVKPGRDKQRGGFWF